MNKECDMNIGYTLAVWLLRIWLATRAIFTGLVKFQGKEMRFLPANNTPEEIQFAKEMQALLDAGESVQGAVEVNTLKFAFMQGLPKAGPMTVETFKASPFMPEFMVVPYSNTLPFLLIGLGIMVLFGICSRISLFFMGLLYISLTFGFIIMEKTMGQDSAAGAAFLGVHVIMIAMALILSKYNKLELLPCHKLPLCNKLCK